MYEKCGHKDAWENQRNPMLPNEAEGVLLGPQDHQKQAKDQDTIEGYGQHSWRKKRS
jgi:hypothetical protein